MTRVLARASLDLWVVTDCSSSLVIAEVPSKLDLLLQIYAYLL